jgi:hypothetical protein
MKALISWISYNNDFVSKDGGGLQVNTEGPHAELYRDMGGYGKHYLLVTNHNSEVEEAPRVAFLKAHLLAQKKWDVEVVPMG